MSNKQHIRELVQKYLDGRATDDEIKLLYQYYNLFDANAVDITDHYSSEQLNVKEKEGFQKIRDQIITKPWHSNIPWGRWFIRTAACIGIALGISNYYSSEYTSHEMLATADQKVDYNRFIELPDGTTVILHGNSQLVLQDNFNRTTRTVTLIGEAFFDVAHQTNSPFIIHTGTLKTTVLGTAFNIKAWPEEQQVIVSVARGSVQVEGRKQQTVILTKNNQVVYSLDQESMLPIIEAPDSSMHWVQTDMTFDNMPFIKLVDHLSQRYSVEFVFENEKLKNCSFTGRFTGIEKLSEILDILSEISNTQYRIENKKILITGNNCF